MSTAFKCNLCGRFYDGIPEMQLRAIIGIIFSPENDSPPDHPQDLCPRCQKAFRNWWCLERNRCLKGVENNFDNQQSFAF